jgi:hypothetical protein
MIKAVGEVKLAESLPFGVVTQTDVSMIAPWVMLQTVLEPKKLEFWALTTGTESIKIMARKAMRVRCLRFNG